MVGDILYSVEVCDDLAGVCWQTGRQLVEQTGNRVDNGDGTETVTVRTRVPVREAKYKFMRLKVAIL
jgi:hypothetical protein